MFEDHDDYFMEIALEEARTAIGNGEVPIGAVVTLDGQVISRAGNRKETLKDPSAHAEVLAIREACLKSNSWRLPEATVYVTVEPCPMCMGALVHARVRRLVYGCRDPKAGACGSLYDLANDARLNHRIEVTTGVKEEECRALMQSFFRELRNSD